MPLVRVGVGNEYRLGAPELYKHANDEDPKAVLDGVAVAGLVGILRQLGDLAEFAAEVFDDLQEEVMITSTRSHKLMRRLKHIDAALSPLEKAVLAQRSHLHLAYTTGCNWHARIRCGENHFVYGDVPQFIINSYEDCCSPPRLHMLDKFDPGGPGSCFRRYSDPTFFKRASTSYGEACTKKIQKVKISRTKRRRSSLRNKKVSRGASSPDDNGRMQFTQLTVDRQGSTSQTESTYGETLKPDSVDQSNINSRNEFGCIEYDDGCSSSPLKSNGQDYKESSSPSKRQHIASPHHKFLEDKGSDIYGDGQNNLSPEEARYSSSSVTWDEKEEMQEPTADYDPHGNLRSFSSIVELDLCRHKESSSPQKRQYNDSPGHSFLEEKDSDACDNSWNNMSVEQTGHSASSVTWDEKGEMLEPLAVHDLDGNSGSLPPNSKLEMDGYKADDFETVYQMDVHPCNEILPVLEYGDKRLHDVGSETDHFIDADALNTIESDPETDIDCMKKNEVRHYPKLEDKIVVNELCEFGTRHSEHHSSNSESGILTNSSLITGSDGFTTSQEPLQTPSAFCCLTDKEAKDKFSSTSQEHNPEIEKTQKASELFNPGSLQGVFSNRYGNVDDAAKQEYVSSKASSSNSVEDASRTPVTNRTRSSLDSQVPLSETPNLASVMFWTNGGLLGLEPSKPPDYSVSSAIPKDSNSGKDEKISTFSQNSSQDVGKPNQEGNFRDTEKGMDMDCSISCQDCLDDGISVRRTSGEQSYADLDVKLEKLKDPSYQNYVNIQAVNTDVQMTKEHMQNNCSSSPVLELAARLTNGSDQRNSLELYENSCPTRNLSANVSKQKNNPSAAYQTLSKDLIGIGCPIMSPSSSPPLEHMKVLFHPIQGFETSKLKLRFPDGNDNPESSRDIFPSFQLVPEVSIAWHNVDSDSDDQIFYRSSSPSVSDDRLSHQSDSDSEQWESCEIPSNNDGDLYDALHRISVTDSVSTNVEKGRTNYREIYDNSILKSCGCGSFDLPSLDNLNHSFMDNSPNVISEDSNHAFDLELSASIISQQPKLTPHEQDQISTTADLLKSKKNGKKEAKQAAYVKNVDEQEDFLYQIKQKSLSLRPTVTAKRTMPQGLPANDSVTAILEKANAIRQAVESDDGENDDAWSDT